MVAARSQMAYNEIKGNTAQFPPDGLSTAPAAAALRIMRYCLRTNRNCLLYTSEIKHPWFDRFLNGYEKLLRFCLKRKAIPLTPVSYTHLDVYKRQGLP